MNKNKLTHVQWAYNAVIYEVNVRQYTPEGTFNALENKLSRLSDLGVTILWFMPIFPIGSINRKGSLGSYYSIQDYKGVNTEFGNIDDFKKLVDKAHTLGMRVILDMVTNHTAWDNVWLQDGNKDWYVQNESGDIVSPFDWSDTAKLNYDNKDMRHAMIDAMKYWIVECGIDGYREDMAGLVPLDFWEEAIPALRDIRPDIYMLGEVESAEYNKEGLFDATYSWEVAHILEHIAKGEYGTHKLKERLELEKQLFPHYAHRLLFTSNHDENSWSGSEFERFGDAVKCMAALTFMLRGVPLIYSGQEAGSDRRLAFFDKDCIEWNNFQEYTPFYRMLCSLRRNIGALWSPELGGDIEYIENSQPYNVLSFKRVVKGSSVIAIFNLTPYEVQPAFYDPIYSGMWHKAGDNELHELYPNQWDPFGAWEYKIYY